MANYSQLKTAIADVIKTNGTQAITGQVLQDVLNSIVSVIGANYQFAGAATPSTNPGTPDQNVFYFATQLGTYSNFGGISITERSLFVFLWNGTWTNIDLLNLDDFYQELDTLVAQFEQQLRQMLDDYQPIVIEGDVTNAPDEEDLTSVGNLLRLKNRGILYGMGCIYLRRELGFAEQLTQENTIYVIRYDYTLTADVTIPANCVLQFDGGSISGAYTITGNNTQIIAHKTSIITDITIAGTWNVPNIYSDWFTDITSTNRIKQLVNLSSDSIYNIIVIEDGTYSVSFSEEKEAALLLKSHTKLIINGQISVVPNALNIYYVVRAMEVTDIEVCGSGTIIGDVVGHTGEEVYAGGIGIEFRQVKYGRISDITVKDCWTNGIYIGGMLGNPENPMDFTNASEHIIISNVTLDNNRANNIAITHGNFIYVKDCIILNAGKTRGTNPMAGIDVESNWENPWWSNNANIYISDCSFSGNSSAGIKVQGAGGVYYENIIIDSCTCDNSFVLRSSNINVNNCIFTSAIIGSNNTTESIDNININGSRFVNIASDDRINNVLVKDSVLEAGTLEYLIRNNSNAGEKITFENSSIYFTSGDTRTVMRNYNDNIFFNNCKIIASGSILDFHGGCVRDSYIECLYLLIITAACLNYRFIHNYIRTTDTTRVFDFKRASSLASSGNFFDVVNNICEGDGVLIYRDGAAFGASGCTAKIEAVVSPSEMTEINKVISPIGTVSKKIYFKVESDSLSGATRPTANLYVGYQFFDTSLSPARPIFVSAISGNTVAWVDATGTAV